MTDLQHIKHQQKENICFIGDKYEIEYMLVTIHKFLYSKGEETLYMPLNNRHVGIYLHTKYTNHEEEKLLNKRKSQNRCYRFLPN